MSVEIESDYLPTRLVTGAGPKGVEAGRPIPAHLYPEKIAVFWLNHQEEKAPESIERLFRPEVLTGYRSSVFQRFAENRLRAFAARSFFDPAAENPRQWAELILASQTYRIAYQLAAAAPRERAGGHDRRTDRTAPGPGPTRDSDCWHYTKAVAFALTTRRRRT